MFARVEALCGTRCAGREQQLDGRAGRGRGRRARMGERERARAALRVGASASPHELRDALRREVLVAAQEDNRGAFEKACAAYAALAAPHGGAPSDAFNAALSEAAPGDVLLRVAAHARARAWLPSRVTSFRRWKWEAASLPSSAIVPQLARRPDDSLGASHSSGRPAAAAAAGAFRALAPYLAADERDALRARFAARPPLDVLAAVLDAARTACSRYESRGANAVATPPLRAAAWPAHDAWADAQPPGDARPQVPGALAAVWARDGASATAGSPWATALFAPPPSSASPVRANASRLDPGAAPFSMRSSSPHNF